MSCKTQVPVAEIAQAVADMLGTPAPPANLDSTILNTPIIRGDVALDAAAKESLCVALTNCIMDAVNPRLQAVEVEAEEALRRADEALRVAQVAKGGSIVEVANEGDLRHIKTQDGSEFTFSVADSPTTNAPTNDVRAVSFAPEGDTVVITMSDGNKLDLTRQQFADWLTEKDSSLATDSEIEAIVEGGNNQVIQELNDRINNLEYDQAVLKRVGDDLVLTNDDGTTSTVSLNGLVKLSDQNGNLLELRQDGLFYGVQASPNLANLYVDGELGDDSISVLDGGGTRAKPLKTLTKALDLSPKDKSNVVHLKSATSSGVAQRYGLGAHHYVKDGAERVITYYDPVYITEDDIACLKQTNLFVESKFAENEVRPVIYPEYYLYNSGVNQKQGMYGFHLYNGSFLTFSGVDIDLVQPTYSVSEYPIGTGYRQRLVYGDGSVSFIAGHLYDYAGSQTLLILSELGSRTNVSFDSFYFEYARNPSGSTNDKYLIAINNGALAVTSRQRSDPNFIATEESQLQCLGEVAQLIPSNTKEVLQADVNIQGIVRHSSGVPLNLTSNFEV